MAELTLYRGQGIVSIAERSPSGEPLGFTDLGNCPRFEIRPVLKRAEHRENRTGKNAIDTIVETGANCQITLELDSTAGVNLCRMLYGKTEQFSTAPPITINSSIVSINEDPVFIGDSGVVNEPVTLWAGATSVLSHIGLSSWQGLRDSAGNLLIQRSSTDKVAWNVEWDGSHFYSNRHGLAQNQLVRLLGVSILPFAVNTDYYAIPIDTNSFQLASTIGGVAITGSSTFGALLIGVYDYQINLASGAITLPSTSRIASGQTVWCSYNYHSFERLYGFVKPAYPVTLLFRGKNTADNDRPLRVKIHRVKLDPTTAWQLIGQTFQRFEVEGLVLKDDRHPDLFEAEFWSNLVVPPPPPPPTYNFANINPEAIDDFAVPIGFANIDAATVEDYPIVGASFANIDPDTLEDFSIVSIGFANVNAEAIES